MSASDDDGPRRRGKVSRRSFLVMAGGLTIGSFALPPLGSAPSTKTRRLIGPPTRWGDDDENLLWSELDESGEAHVMMWTPGSKAEARAIEAFYQAAMKVDWDKVVIADVPKPGDDKADEPQGPKSRRFEYRGEGSAKFWEVTPDDILCTYTVTFGRIGTKGQSRTTEVEYDYEVHEAVTKLIAEKLAKGYVEVGGVPPIPPVAERDWSRPESWQEVRKSIEVRAPNWGKPTPLPTEAEMDVFEAAHDFKLPPSYRAFLKVFGPGEVNSMFYLAAPGGPEHYNLEMTAEKAREDVENEQKYQDVDFASDEYVGREPITRMVVFCSWDSDRWGWAPDEPRGGGEYAIRNWPRHGDAEIEAESFPEFIIDKLFRGGLGDWVGGENPGFMPATGRKKTPSRKRAAKAAAAPKPKPKRRSAPEENEHLRRIAADPDDEAARLAYADGLDQYRDPVGDLIRVRLERAKLPASDPRSAELARGEEALMARVAKKKTGKHDRLLAFGLLPWALARLGARVWCRDDGQIHHIELTDYQVNAGAIREFAAYPALHDLKLNDHTITTEELDAAGRLASLDELHLHDVGIADGGFKRLGRLVNLGYLCLLKPHTRGPGLAHLKGLPKLGTLILQGVAASKVPAHLAALESWPALRKLFLTGDGFHGQALAGLARLGRLEYLGLDDCPVRDADLAHLAALTNLKWLNLSETRITGAGLKHLQKLRSLEVLKTKEMPAADAAAPWLARLTNLRELELGGRHENKSLTDAGAARLAPLVRLTHLNVEHQRLTDAALTHFAGFLDLEELNLANNRGIVGPGLEHLKHLPRLRRLNLDSTGVSNASIPLLRTFSRLEELSLFQTRIDERGLKTLRKALPKTKTDI